MFPRNEFNKAVCLQTILNELMHWVANDNDFLRETLANTIKVDDFTRRLYNIHERIISEGGPSQVSWINSICGWSSGKIPFFVVDLEFQMSLIKCYHFSYFNLKYVRIHSS